MSAIVRVTWVRVPHVHRDGGGSVGADREHVQIMECLTCPGGAAVVANLDIDHHGSRSVRCPVAHPHPTPARHKRSHPGQLKAYLRKAKARSVETLWTIIGRFIQTVTPQQCANYIAHDGYGPTQVE